MPFTFRYGSIPGLMIVEPRRFQDERGFFMETWQASDFIKAGIPGPFLQDNHSSSARGTVRGMHFQRAPHAQGKLVRVVRGAAWDVAVDLRDGSSHFGTWQAMELSAENGLLLYIPPGFAHGFLALEEGTELLYKCTAEYHAASEGGIRWDDPGIGISWPLSEVLVSSKDTALPPFDLRGGYFTIEAPG